MTLLFDIRNLTFSYVDRVVINGLSLQLKKGEVVSLLGANGCGKSTLINLMLGLLIGNGDIVLNNKPIGTYTRREIAGLVAYIPQSQRVLFNYSVLEMVLMGRVAQRPLFSRVSETDKQAAKDALSVLGVSDLADFGFSTLSGGQKQMVFLARALAQGARVFLMDEPVTGLDYGNQIRLLEMINHLSAKGYTFLQSTHYPDHALLVSTRVLIMESGQICKEGPPEKIITSELLKSLYNVSANVVTVDSRRCCIPNMEMSMPD